MFKEYDAKELELLKKAEVSILKDFSEVCNKHGITWFAIGGSVIGAARHQGFIPWDDDLDLGMLRKDFDRFLEIWESELGDKYHLASPDTDKEYSSAVVKLMRKGTKFVPEFLDKSNAQLGIHIDLFAYDNYTNDEKSVKQIKQARFWDQLLFLKGSGRPSIPFKGVKKAIASIICQFIHGVLVLFRVSSKWMFKKFNEVAQRYDDIDTEYVTIYQDAWIHESRMAKSEIFPLKYLKFEDVEIPVQNDYMTILERYYGSDVMQLPPVEKRVNHAPSIIEFGPFKDELMDVE